MASTTVGAAVTSLKSMKQGTYTALDVIDSACLLHVSGRFCQAPVLLRVKYMSATLHAQKFVALLPGSPLKRC
jgi:hypothetical protein